MPPILDAAIGTVFVFLLFSLVIAALNELILSFFDQRARFLHMGLMELLGEGKTQLNKTFGEQAKRILSGGLLGKINLGPLTQSLCTHGVINAFSRSDKGAGDSPNYIPAGAFVTVLLDLISKPLDGGTPASAGHPPRDPAEEMQNMQTQIQQQQQQQQGASMNSAPAAASTSHNQQQLQRGSSMMMMIGGDASARSNNNNNNNNQKVVFFHQQTFFIRPSLRS